MDIFDEYLQMVWNLALAMPIPYVEGSLFDQTVSDDWAYFYKLANTVGASASALDSSAFDGSVRELAGLPERELKDDVFRVFVDELELSRPIKYRNLPTTSHVLKKPMAFLGHLREDFEGIDVTVSAGALEFDAYLFWNPKVVPTEHQGVLVRIHGASGTLFDSTFFNYQVAELTRLRQITCEIFVTEGLEAALNIDRESFNTSHPHTIVLTRWLHSALRQLATAQKREAHLEREEGRQVAKAVVSGRLEAIAVAANSVRTDGEGILPRVRVLERSDQLGDSEAEEARVYDLTSLRAELPDLVAPNTSSSNVKKLEAIGNVLEIYGVMDSLSQWEQENLLAAMLAILESESNG
ncbi:hypothetical protein [Clavibacter phaseoli]|uniref:hypothetical protein n=1 Tax=Clavibacter phaseoli TaxID=1734031 RepID=UPI002174F24A|nr:hypothetical protein [Clavibacter phaseoli]